METTQSSWYQFDDLTDDFAQFYEASQNLSDVERVARFKDYFADRFPGFYSADRISYLSQSEYDQTILQALKRFPERRSAIATRAARFSRQLEQAFKRFRRVYPDIEPIGPVYALHSLGEFDGAVRNVNGQDFLIFGIDVMDLVHTFDDEMPFIHHELFHVYHSQFFEPCNAIWCSLWAEGLAVAVAHSLNPDASDAELLLDSPQPQREVVDANIELAVCEVLEHFDSVDDEIYSSIFGSEQLSDRLPPRFGYYLGYRVVEQAERTTSLSDLTKMTADDAGEVVQRSLHELGNCTRCTCRLIPRG